MEKRKTNNKATEAVKVSVHNSPQLPLSDDTIYEAISRVVNMQDPIITTKEVTRLFDGKSDSTTYKKLTGSIRMSVSQICNLIRETASRGDFALLDLVTPSGYSLEPHAEPELNGDIDDEIGRLTEKVGIARQHLNHGRTEKALFTVRSAKEELYSMEREARARRVA